MPATAKTESTATGQFGCDINYHIDFGNCNSNVPMTKMKAKTISSTLNCSINSPINSTTPTPTSSTSILLDSPNYFKVSPNIFSTSAHTNFSALPASNSSANSIWSPTMLENPVSSSCLDSRSWNQGGGVVSSASTAYQNFSGYYSNIDYLGTSVQQQLHENALEGSWMKREENWFYNNPNWDAQRK